MLKSDRILALDIGASGLKMAEFASLKSGGVELVNFALGSLGADGQSESDRAAYIVTTIREMMREKNIKPGPVLVSVSGQSVFSRFVKLPSVDAEKVHQIIQYEAQQNVPFPMSEVVWDYQLIGGAEGELDVMLAAIKAEIIEDLTDCVQAAGLEPDLVDVAPMALYNAVRYNYGDLQGCTLVVDMGARSTNLIFIEEGRIFSRSIPVAGNAITQQIMREFEMPFPDAEDLKRAHAFVAFGGAYEGPSSEVADKVSKSVRSVMTRMHAEINRSINFYRSQQAGSKPATILLTGGTSVIPYTDTFLKDKLKVEVDYLNPFRNVAVDDSISADEIGKNAHLLGETVGLSLRRVLSCPIEINLMPQKVLADKALRKKVPFLFVAGAGLVLILAIWCGFFFRMTQLAQQRQVKVARKVQGLQGVSDRVGSNLQQGQQVAAKADELLALVGRRTSILGILDEVHASLPEGMWLTSVKPIAELVPAENPLPGQPAEKPMITKLELAVEAYVDKVNSASGFLEALRASEMFAESGTRVDWRPTPRDDDFAREFRLIVALETPLSQ